jgi:hypothetical protein
MIQHAYDQGVAGMRRALAARGMLQSGDLTGGQQAQEYTRGASESSAFNDFIGNVIKAGTDWSTGVTGIEGGEQEVYNNVIGQIIKDNPADPGHPATGHWEPNPPPVVTPPPNPPPKPLPGSTPAPSTPIPGIGGPRPPYHYTDPTKPVRRIGGWVD